MMHTTTSTNRFSRLAVLAMVALAGGVAAIAQPVLAVRPDEPQKAERPTVREQLAQRDAERKVMPPGQAFGGQVNSMVMFDDGTKSIRIRNGVAESAKIDGKEYDGGQIKRDGDDFVVSDKEGKEVARFAGLGKNGGGEGQPRVQTFRVPGIAGIEVAPGGVTTRSVVGNGNTKVMIGVQMAQPSAELAGHFGIKPGEATLVTFVHKDTPADAAGLKQYDIILQIKDDAATPERVRKAVQTGKPGDELALKVLQRGVEKTLTLKLAKYDSTKLSEVPPMDGPADQWLIGPNGERLGGLADRFNARAGALPNMGPEGVMDDRTRAEIDRQMRDAFKDFNHDFGLAPGQNPFIIIDNLRGNWAGNEPGDVAVEAADRMARLEARLEQMEKMLRDALKDRGEKPAEGKDKPAGKAPGEKHTMILMPTNGPV